MLIFNYVHNFACRVQNEFCLFFGVTISLSTYKYKYVPLCFSLYRRRLHEANKVSNLFNWGVHNFHFQPNINGSVLGYYSRFYLILTKKSYSDTKVSFCTRIRHFHHHNWLKMMQNEWGHKIHHQVCTRFPFLLAAVLSACRLAIYNIGALAWLRTCNSLLTRLSMVRNAHLSVWPNSSLFHTKNTIRVLQPLLMSSRAVVLSGTHEFTL